MADNTIGLDGVRATAERTAESGLNLLAIADQPPARSPMAHADQSAAAHRPGVPADQSPEHGADKVATLRDHVAKTYGLEAREQGNGQVVFYFKAGGVERGVTHVPDTVEGMKQAQRDVQAVIDGKMSQLHRDFKVNFAKPGEDVTRTYEESADCQLSRGEMTHATQPTLPALFAIEEALLRSQPSQLTADGKDGLKFYFLDKSPFPLATEGRPVLGVFVEHDKDNHSAVYITPEGAQLPPTAADQSDPDGRNLLWCLIHEMEHNGQANAWAQANEAPDFTEAYGLGWSIGKKKADSADSGSSMFWMLRDQSGNYYRHEQPGCGVYASWYHTSNTGERLPDQPDPISGDDLRLQLTVKPATRYFTTPKEELAESGTAFRYGSETRAKLLHESPGLYELTKRLDQDEIVRTYGVTPSEYPRYVRDINGKLVDWTPDAERAIADFESKNR